MKKRNEKIKEIENLIEKNRYSRREFIGTVGKTTALSVIAALGLTSLLSCEKEQVYEENEKAKKALCPGTYLECLLAPVYCDVDCSIIELSCTGDFKYLHSGGLAS